MTSLWAFEVPACWLRSAWRLRGPVVGSPIVRCCGLLVQLGFGRFKEVEVPSPAPLAQGLDFPHGLRKASSED